MAKSVRDPFETGVRGQESVAMDLQFGGLDCQSANDDMARQEYALQSDLAYQVQRFGVGHHGVSGVVDFDAMDLTTALQIVEESSQAWLRLPKVIRDRYQSWANVEKAAQTGELEQVLKAAGVAAAPAAASAASPSDSAADATPKA